jgi:hypothetical protein
MINRVISAFLGSLLVAVGILAAVGIGLFVLGWFIPGAPWSIEAIAWMFTDSHAVEGIIVLPGIAYFACRFGLALLSAVREAGRVPRAPAV